jgi:Rrf2 family protein
MLSSTSNYALRAVLAVAGDPGNRPLRANEIAEATGTPRNYMGKTLNSLVKAGVLKSARGPQGGFSLAVAAETLTIARVIDCFDEPRPHVQCLLGRKACNPATPCSAHTLWNSINTRRREPLVMTTVAQLLGAVSTPNTNSTGE